METRWASFVHNILLFKCQPRLVNQFIVNTKFCLLNFLFELMDTVVTPNVFYPFIHYTTANVNYHYFTGHGKSWLIMVWFNQLSANRLIKKLEK